MFGLFGVVARKVVYMSSLLIELTYVLIRLRINHTETQLKSKEPAFCHVKETPYSSF